MNQLQNLLHDSLIATGHVEKAALLNKEDYSVKATSVGYQINQTDIESLIDAFNNPALTRERGVYFGETLFTCLRSDEDSIYAKNNSKGFVMVQTDKCILMGTYSENMFPSVCVEAIEKLADYFRQKGL